MSLFTLIFGGPKVSKDEVIRTQKDALDFARANIGILEKRVEHWRTVAQTHQHHLEELGRDQEKALLSHFYIGGSLPYPSGDTLALAPATEKDVSEMFGAHLGKPVYWLEFEKRGERSNTPPILHQVFLSGNVDYIPVGESIPSWASTCDRREPLLLKNGSRVGWVYWLPEEAAR